MTENVRLIGGPFDGQEITVDVSRRLITLEWEEELEQRDEEGCTLYVTKVGLAAYRRCGPHHFIHSRVPSSIGDTNLTLPESQMRLVEEDEI